MPVAQDAGKHDGPCTSCEATFSVLALATGTDGDVIAVWGEADDPTPLQAAGGPLGAS